LAPWLSEDTKAIFWSRVATRSRPPRKGTQLNLAHRDHRAVIYRRIGAVASLVLDSPSNRNALSPEVLDGLGDGLVQAGRDPEVRVVVLTHSGPVFCAGANLSGADRPEGTWDLAGVLEAICSLDKPVVARIDGHCFGGGVGLAAACDISLCSEQAAFAFSEVRLGVAPAIISVVCLPKMSRADALELFLTGERFSAARAAAVGLITRAVPSEDLDAQLHAVLASLLAGAPGALAAAKRLVYDHLRRADRAEAFRLTSELSQMLFASKEAAEGIAAFRDKRAPAWRQDPPEDSLVP
jgi:methylglutaconyl-CoA hydratase